MKIFEAILEMIVLPIYHRIETIIWNSQQQYVTAEWLKNQNRRPDNG